MRKTAFVISILAGILVLSAVIVLVCDYSIAVYNQWGLSRRKLLE